MTMIETVLKGQVDESFLLEVQKWAGEVMEKTGPGMAPDRISFYLWEKEKDFQEFDVREKAELGVVTGDESNFLATHEAWRGYPRIHLSLEKIRSIPEEIIPGVVQHEIGHALLHGKPEFYQFLFSEHLQETARSQGPGSTLAPAVGLFAFRGSERRRSDQAVAWVGIRTLPKSVTGIFTGRFRGGTADLGTD